MKKARGINMAKSTDLAKKFKWNNVSDTFLQCNWMEMRVIDIAEQLGVSKNVVMRRARKLGLDKKPVGGLRSQYYRWSIEMDAYLKANYMQLSNQELASHLVVSIQALMRRMKKLGLARSDAGHKHHKWVESEVTLLNSLFKSGEPISAIAEAVGVSTQTVKRKLKALGLTRKSTYAYQLK